MQLDLEPSIVGLTVQWGGVALVTILSFLMAQTFRRAFLEYWAYGWGCLMVGLTSLLISFSLPVPPKFLYSIYFLGAYSFGYLLLAGCRNYATGYRLRPQQAWLVFPAVLFSFLLPYASEDFNVLNVPHAAIMAGLCGTAYYVLQPMRRRDSHCMGLSSVSVALLGLTVLFLHYVVVCSYVSFGEQLRSFPYLKYSSLYDLLVEMLLAFGTVILLMENMRRQLEGENHRLSAARAELQALAELDPLTEVLNRHAFYSYLQADRRQPSRLRPGSLAVVDVNDFKTINDTLGHSAGDSALRAVAGAIRNLIRADDLLFRWGGDEFLLILVGLDEHEARARLEKLNSALTGIVIVDSEGPTDLLVSYGVAPLRDVAEIDQVIEQADQEMYQYKAAAKSGRLFEPTAGIDFAT